MVHTPRSAVAVAGCALVLSACGSTAPYTGAATADLGVPSAQPSTGAVNNVGQSLGGPNQLVTTGTAGGGQGVPSQGPGAGNLGGGPNAVASAALGPGVTATTIHVGFTIQENNAAVSSIASTYNVQLPNNRGADDAFIAYINAHGGVAGRKLVPDFYTYDPSSGTSDQLGQAACASFTQDHQVFAALDAFVPNPTFNTCMQRAGRPMLEYGLWFGSSSSWSKYSNEVAADGLPFDTAATILAKRLASTGFLSTSTHLGVLVRTSADMQEAYSHGFGPALAKLGLKVDQTQYLRDAQAESDISGYTADISSAVLKFASSGINRVVFFDAGSYSALVFSQTAERQQYRPHYAFTSLNGVVSLTGSSSSPPPQQLTGAQGISWETNADGLATGHTPLGQLCLSILKAAGIDISNATTDASYLETCQTFFLFRSVADAVGSNLNRDTFLNAVDNLGSTFTSTNTWGGVTRFGANDHHGVSVFRPFAYVDSCQCFKVSGPPQPVDAS